MDMMLLLLLASLQGHNIALPLIIAALYNYVVHTKFN